MTTIKQFFDCVSGFSIENNPLRHPKLAIKLKHELEKVKIKEFRYGGRFQDDDCHKDLTLIINPNYDSSYNANYLSSPSFSDLVGYRGGVNYYIPTTLEKKRIMVKIRDEEFEMGCYFKERNVIIIYFPIFNTELKLIEKNELLFFFIDNLTKWMTKNKIKKVNTSKFMEDRMKKKFSKESKRQITEKEQQIRDRTDSIKSYEMSIINHYKANTTDIELVKSLKIILKNMDNELTKQIREIKSLKFVKSAELTLKGITIDVGKITIKWKGQEVYIGDFIIHITPTKVSFENKKKLVHPQYPTGIIHPHIRGDAVCYGNRGNKVRELLGKNEFKKLVYFLYLFLKGYNENDCYSKILYWLRLNEKGESIYATDDDEEYIRERANNDDDYDDED